MMQYDIRRLDIYRKVPKDLTQPTYAGACISILSCFFMAFLFYSELMSFLTPNIITDMFVSDPTDIGERINVYIDVNLLKMECKYLGLDIQDDLGRHEVGFVEDVDLKPDGEGCHFKAKFRVNKVPGNFHISTHAAREQPSSPDMTHIVNEVIFGDRFTQSIKLPGSFNPLGRVNHSISDPLDTHEYFLKVVPTLFEREDGVRISNPYQYTFAHRTNRQYAHMHQIIPAIWFKYDLTPITVRYVYKGKPFYSFLTSVCAIVGGTFTVAGIIDSMFFTATEIFKKAQLGKLN